MDYYHIWCDVKDSHRDIEFAENVAKYMGYLREGGLIEGYTLSRCKLGFRPPELAEFHIVIETRNMAQLEEAFQTVATRSGEVERLHAAVYSAVSNVRFALYRDFPDATRISL
ncbi:MAG: hypothetical protein O3A46_08570 [Candidatus Poribacteria bacterium]|nr:hypothetical protein [Candidatus Poribacteria bacterium]